MTHSAPETDRFSRGPSAVSRSGLRERLTAAAIVLFAEKGFEGTSVQDICEAVGVTKGGFYHHFKSKDELLYDINASILGLQMAEMVAVAESDAPLLTRLRSIGKDVVWSSIEHLNEVRIFWRSMHQLSPELQATVRAERRRYHERMRELMEEGRASGIVRTDIPTDIMIDFFYGTVHKLDSWYREDGALSGEQVADFYANLFISSISPVRG